MEEIYFRIEVIGDENHGAGAKFSPVMNKNGLNPTWSSHQHWFTPKGFEKVGIPIVKDALDRGINIRVRTNKLSTLKKKTRFKVHDELQVTVRNYKKGREKCLPKDVKTVGGFSLYGSGS